MGSFSSRPRPPGQDAQPYTVTYAPHTPGQFTQAPAYYGGPAHVGSGFQNNGQYYGGWRPQAGPTTPPVNRQYPGQQTLAPVEKQLNQTATIRNAVNVKKHTLALTPVDDNPKRLAISFQFDASSPSVVTTFVAAVEDANDGCKLTPSKQPAAAGLQYEKGLGLQFPRPGTDAAARAFIDLSLYDEAELMGQQENKYPLIIRLETVTEKGLAEGHSLTELTPGGPQKVWVQSQTTFAQLVKDEEGHYQARVIKQKIWVEGISYELQEIYGMEHASAAARDKEGTVKAAEQDEERLCVICLVNDRDTTVLPCRHMCMCHECAQELRKQTSKCPICRNHVDSLLHIRMSRQQAPKNPATPVDHGTVSAALEELRMDAKGKGAATATA